MIEASSQQLAGDLLKVIGYGLLIVVGGAAAIFVAVLVLAPIIGLFTKPGPALAGIALLGIPTLVIAAAVQPSFGVALIAAGCAGYVGSALGLLWSE